MDGLVFSKDLIKKYFNRWRVTLIQENQSGAPVFKRLLTELRFFLWSTDDELQFEGGDEADERNAKQIKKITQPATIWHAVSHYHSKEGKDSWDICRLIIDGCRWSSPWMLGQDRGIFGETPLHLALLFNEPNEDFQNFFEDLWAKCPKIHAAQYTHALYAGENVLHIAIIRKAGMRLIRTMVESPQGPVLLSQRAAGVFFKDPRRSDGCCSILGEYPLCFAACTNQMGVFDYLLDKGADPEARTSEENNLLHLLVLNTNPSLPPSSAAADAHCVYLEIYDSVETRLRARGVYDRLRRARNAAGHTPLSLAAAVGSEAMFEHLFRKELSVTWTYGPAVCRRLDLAGIDVPLGREETPPASAASSVLEARAASLPSLSPPSLSPHPQDHAAAPRHRDCANPPCDPAAAAGAGGFQRGACVSPWRTRPLAPQSAACIACPGLRVAGPTAERPGTGACAPARRRVHARAPHPVRTPPTRETAA